MDMLKKMIADAEELLKNHKAHGVRRLDAKFYLDSLLRLQVDQQRYYVTWMTNAGTEGRTKEALCNEDAELLVLTLLEYPSIVPSSVKKELAE